MQAFSTQLFYYNKNTRTFVAMASDLQFQSTPTIELVSHKTGKSRMFVRWKTHRDGENAISHWEYRCLPRLSQDPPTIKVMIYND